ncbi:MAG: DUF4118 domain-containing protein [Candidatus Limnocylindrales bacterium]
MSFASLDFRIHLSRVLRSGAISAGALAASTVVIAFLQSDVHVPSAAPVYLLAVLAVGIACGTIPAVLTAVASFLLYDFLFVQPLYTFTVSDPNEWLDLLLFLAVAVAIGRLAALQAERTTEAALLAREAQALFRISRSLATSEGLREAAHRVLAELTAATRTRRIWIGLGPTPAEERILADTGQGIPPPDPTWNVVLQRSPDDLPARWVRTHVGSRTRLAAPSGEPVAHRIRMEVPGEVLGSLWILAAVRDGDPDRAETRILSAAADQLGQAVRRDRLVRDALEAEVARRSETLKTALLDSVSHDLRTPLATIRAAAGSMLDPAIQWTAAERREALRSIDLEAERMNRLVRNLLDLSRIEGGALRPELEPHDVDELVGRVVKRTAVTRDVRLELPSDLPPIVVDDTYLDEILTNLVENAIRYGGPTIRISAVSNPDDTSVAICVEDDGDGVPADDLGHLVEKFYRVRRRLEGSRHGMGIGLAVADGLTRAMGGTLEAGRSDLGGLAMRVTLSAAPAPPEPTIVTPSAAR